MSCNIGKREGVKMENLDKLVRQLCAYPDETPWLEFKHNNYDPEMIGQDISALANSATLDEKAVLILYGVSKMARTSWLERTKIFRI